MMTRSSALPLAVAGQAAMGQAEEGLLLEVGNPLRTQPLVTSLRIELPLQDKPTAEQHQRRHDQKSTADAHQPWAAIPEGLAWLE